MGDTNTMDPAVSAASNRVRSNSARAVRKKALSKTIRDTREMLTTEDGISIAFDKDLIFAHARNIRAASIVLPTLTVLIGFISVAWLNYFWVLTWLVCALLSQSLVIVLNGRLLRERPSKPEDVARWRRNLICGDLLCGIVWSTYMIIPETASSMSLPVFSFATLLIVVAIYSFAAAPVFVGMLSITAPITMALFLKFSLNKTPEEVMMAGLFAAAQLLFILVARQVRDALVRLFETRAEKDVLIVDLEEAKSISEDSRRRAEEANLAKSRFLATMSHELRTPLNAILGFSEVIKEELLGPLENPSYKEYVTDIHSSGQHLLNLINEILDLSRIEAGKYELAEDAVYLFDIVEDCQTLMQLRAKSKDLTVQINGEENMPRMWADERAIRQIVLNLMSNAIKFTPRGGEIMVNVGWTSGGGQYISVQDNGPGIPEEEIPVVLSQFGQGSISIKSAEQGTGLGLPIVQALVNMHGGTFDLKSKLRAGTRVTVSLPRNRVMEALAPLEAIASQSVASVSGQRIVARKTA
ncbi:MAG: HAMP domain-containing sensor histidine kinase [Pseudomonadota bacterium]